MIHHQTTCVISDTIVTGQRINIKLVFQHFNLVLLLLVSSLEQKFDSLITRRHIGHNNQHIGPNKENLYILRLSITHCNQVEAVMFLILMSLIVPQIIKLTKAWNSFVVYWNFCNIVQQHSHAETRSINPLIYEKIAKHIRPCFFVSKVVLTRSVQNEISRLWTFSSWHSKFHLCILDF